MELIYLAAVVAVLWTLIGLFGKDSRPGFFEGSSNAKDDLIHPRR